MRMRSFLILICGLAVVAPEILRAQPGYMRRGPRKRSETRSERYETKAKRRKEKRRRKNGKRDKKGRKGAKGKKAGTDKASIESYLQTRLKFLKKAQRSQGIFGVRMKRSWDKFWSAVYEDRKQFEVRMARQRLNLFETLNSLDENSHGATIGDFERLQYTQIKAFEGDLRSRMDKFFAQLQGDLRKFAAKQESDRLEFKAAADEAWRSQRSGG